MLAIIGETHFNEVEIEYYKILTYFPSNEVAGQPLDIPVMYNLVL